MTVTLSDADFAVVHAALRLAANGELRDEDIELLITLELDAWNRIDKIAVGAGLADPQGPLRG